MVYKLVAFDCDGVLVDTTSSWDFIHRQFGVDNEKSVQAYFKGEIDGMEFMRRDIGLWRSLDPDISLQKIKAILMKIPPMKGLDELAQALRTNGCKIIIISGGLDLLVDEIGKRIGAFRAYSNGLESDREGKLTGEGILRVEPKDKRGPLREAMKVLKVAKNEVAAVGDTAGDASMFSCCGLGIAFNTEDNIVKKKAKVVIKERDLRKLIEVLC